MKNIKAIIFDAYGTLFDVNSAAQKCKNKIGDKWEAFANYWRTNQLEYTWLRSLMNRHKDFWQITEDSLDKSMKAFSIDASMRNELLDLYKVLSPFEEVPEVLKELKNENLKLAILSNGTPSLLKELVKVIILKISLMIYFLLKKLEYINQVQKFTSFQSINTKYKKMKLLF
jgi:2-haloacid dehalogenase